MKEEILKEIIPSKLTNNSEQNIKLIKRKLSIYNLKNQTNYTLEDFGLDIIYNRHVDKTSIFYYYTELNENFDLDSLDNYKKKYNFCYNFLIETLDKCESDEKVSLEIYFSLDGKRVLEQNLKSSDFWISDPLIWSKFESKFLYSGIEISNLCNAILEEYFNVSGFYTGRFLGNI